MVVLSRLCGAYFQKLYITQDVVVQNYPEKKPQYIDFFHFLHFFTRIYLFFTFDFTKYFYDNKRD